MSQQALRWSLPTFSFFSFSLPPSLPDRGSSLEILREAFWFASSFSLSLSLSFSLAVRENVSSLVFAYSFFLFAFSIFAAFVSICIHAKRTLPRPIILSARREHLDHPVDRPTCLRVFCSKFCVLKEISTRCLELAS